MTKILMLDLETTGLDIERDPILEVGAILYDLKEEKELAVFHSLPTAGSSYRIEYTSHIHPVVYRMHSENGLFDEINKSGVEFDLQATGRALIDAIRATGMWKGECMMAGRTPSFDRRRLERHIPELDAFLSHRMIDVSTLTQLSKIWGPEKVADPTAKRDPHRALKDCREAIATLLRYRSIFSTFDLFPERATVEPQPT